MTYARDHVFECSAVEDRRDILEAALNRGMGQSTIAQVRQEFERRVQTGEFIAVEHVGVGQQYTTATMLRMEREIIGHMEEGNRRGYNDPMLVPPHIGVETEDRHRELNAGQRQAVEEIFLSREKIVGLDGIAGAGKTTTLVHRPHSYLHYCDFRLQWEHAESGSSGLARSYDESRAGPTVAIALGFARFGTAKPDYFGGRCRQDQSANR